MYQNRPNRYSSLSLNKKAGSIQWILPATNFNIFSFNVFHLLLDCM
jgi:hypothetical protein